MKFEILFVREDGVFYVIVKKEQNAMWEIHSGPFTRRSLAEEIREGVTLVHNSIIE